MQPLVSIILPVYNGENYLEECLESIFNQSYTNFELIVINDGSTDETENILQNQLDERLVYLKNENNLGISKSLNKAIDKAKGDFLLRMDSDDFMLQTKIEQQVNYLLSHPKVSILGTRFEQMNHERPLFINLPLIDSDIKLLMFLKCPICHPTVMIRHTVWKQLNLNYDESITTAEDYQLWAKAFMCGITFANLPEQLLLYRQHLDQNTDRHLNTLIKLDNEIRLQLAKHFFNEIIEKFGEGIYLQFINSKFGSFDELRSIKEMVKMLTKCKIEDIEVKASGQFWIQTWEHYSVNYAYNYTFINYKASFNAFKFFLSQASFLQPKEVRKKLRFILVGLGIIT